MHHRAIQTSLAVLLTALSFGAAATETLRCIPSAPLAAKGGPPAGIPAESESLIVLEIDAFNKSVRLQKAPWSGPPLDMQSWTDQNIQLVQRQSRPILDRFVVQQTLIMQLDRSTGVFRMIPSFAAPDGRPMSNDDLLKKLKEYGIRPQYAGLPMEPVTALCSPVQKIF